MGWESSDVFRFDPEPLLQCQTRTAKLKMLNNSFVIDPRGLQCETNLQDIVGWESSDVRFHLWRSFKVKRGYPDLKVLITSLLLVLEVCNVKPTCRISWAENLLVLSDLTFFPPSRLNDGSLALVSCLSGGYRYASVLQCVGLVLLMIDVYLKYIGGKYLYLNTLLKYLKFQILSNRFNKLLLLPVYTLNNVFN